MDVLGNYIVINHTNNVHSVDSGIAAFTHG